MINIVVRTVILYILVVALMRLTGKRQIGQLELTELVTAFMISELAANPISDNSIPILYGIIPGIILVCLEVLLSFISIKSKIVRKMLSGSALALIKKGKLDKEQMKKARITVEELVSAMRSAGTPCMSDVDYAFLEPNGTISIIQKATHIPPSADDMGISVSEQGIEHPIIIDGNINKKELYALGVNDIWLEKKLKENGFKNENDVFYMGVNDLLEVYIVGKDDEKN